MVSNNYLQKLSQKLKNTKTVVGHFLWISAAICGKVGHVISFSCSQWVDTMVLPFAFWCNSSKLPKLACPTLWGILYLNFKFDTKMEARRKSSHNTVALRASFITEWCCHESITPVKNSSCAYEHTGVYLSKLFTH